MTLRENEERIGFLLKISDAIRPIADPVAIQDLITNIAMDHFKSDRCYYAEIEDDQAIVHRDASKGLPSIAGTYSLSESPIFMSIVDAGKTYTVNDVQTSDLIDHPLRQICLQLQLISFIDAPIIKQGAIVGLFCIVQSTPRNWTPSEIELLEEVAERTWAAVERGKVENALRQSEEKYRTLFKSIDEGFCVVEVLFNEEEQPHDYRFLEVNPAFEQQTELVVTIGKTVQELIPGVEDHWIKIYGEVAKTRKPVRFEAEAAGLNGWFDVYAFPYSDHNDNKVAILFNNVTKRKNSELALLEADRRKNEFLATLAHELRNPLTPIIGALRIAARSNKKAEYKKSYAVIERQVQQIMYLVNDLLDISRITQNKIHLKKARIDVAEPIEVALETVKPLLLIAEHEFSTQFPAVPVYIKADGNRIAQILINLLTNAIKYTDPGGKVELSVSVENQQAVIRVKDSGIGLSEDALENIFEMFHQVQNDENRIQSGLGIGLSLVKGLVTLHGGTISAQSAGKGKGSVFTCRLPMAAVQKSGQKTPPSGRSGKAANISKDLRILLVDDNEDAAIAIQLNLQMEGYTVQVSFSGQSALDNAADFQPDAAILDIGLPDIIGYEVGRQLRKQFPDLLLIAHTGWGMEEDRRQSKEAGFDHHLVKPALVEELIAVLEQGR